MAVKNLFYGIGLIAMGLFATPAAAQSTSVLNLPPAGTMTGAEILPVIVPGSHPQTLRTTTAAIAAMVPTPPTIAQFPVAATLSDADIVAMSQAGANKQSTVSDIGAHIGLDFKTGKINGAYVASSCGNSPAPSWCAGSDAGAWINAAIAAGNSGIVETPVRILLNPTVAYTQTTSIVLPRNVSLDCQGAALNYMPTTGAQVVLGSNPTYGSLVGAISNCTLNGPGYTAGNTDYGIFMGGDPAGIISAPENFGDNKAGYNVHITGHAYGVGWGNNAWSAMFEGFTIVHNQEGIYTPAQALGASISAFSIAGNVVTLTTGTQSFTAGQTLNIKGLTVGTYLNGVALTISSATSTTVTAAFAHADVGSTAASGAAYAGGYHNSGELIRFIGAQISNNFDCGIYGQGANGEVSITDSSMDYNVNGAACGPGVNLTLINDHLEQTAAPFFNFSHSTYIRVVNGSIVMVGTTGTDDGIALFTYPTSYAVFNNIFYYSRHVVNNWVYTTASTVAALCIRDPYYNVLIGSIAYTNVTSPPSCVQN